MDMAQPHYLLFCNTHLFSSQHQSFSATSTHDSAKDLATSTISGRWHFVLERLDGNERMEVADSETRLGDDRLSLLCLVRGLEALEQPSHVTLVTTSKYVARGIRYGLNSWRESNYTWESFGIQRPVRNSDLWRRVDGAMEFHALSCKLIQPSAVPTKDASHHSKMELVAAENPVAPPPAPHLPSTQSKPSETPVIAACQRFVGSRLTRWQNLIQPRPALYGA